MIIGSRSNTWIRNVRQPCVNPSPILTVHRYVNEATAAASGLIQTGSGSARMNVDSTHTYNPNTGYYGVNGVGRPSVRIESKKSWTHGLFIAKIDHMPGGICGTWPACE